MIIPVGPVSATAGGAFSCAHVREPVLGWRRPDLRPACPPEDLDSTAEKNLGSGRLDAVSN